MMLWEKPIEVGEYSSSPELMAKAWLDWMSRGKYTRDDLVSALSRAGEKKFHWTIASRMLQRAKRAGVIRFNGRVWEKVQNEGSRP